MLSAKNNGAVDDSENGYSYAFINSSVGVYRESIPEDVEEMIAEMEQDGIDTSDNEDIEYEKRKANYWATIGIGKRDTIKHNRKSNRKRGAYRSTMNDTSIVKNQYKNAGNLNTRISILSVPKEYGMFVCKG